MIDFKAVEKKWQKNWQEARLFEAEVDQTKPKFFVTFPYPYMNGYSHIGHFYSAMRVEILARYKRMRGFNVLFPQAWHCTGSPILAAAQRIKEQEPKQLQIMKDMGFTEEETKKFSEPTHWIEFFPREWKKDFQEAGMSIDFRREFITTNINPYYDKFIQWQFRRLKELGYIIQGKFPVVWCPKDNTPLQDHSRIEGEGETTQEFTLLKFKTGPDYLVAATLRPETIFGQTNLWVNPDVTYVKAGVNNETWILSEAAALKLKEQERNINILTTLPGTSLLGKYAIAPFINKQLLILPSSFCDPDKGTGIVTSVPSDAPDDWIGLYDLQKDDSLAKKYTLDYKEILELKPVPIITSQDLGELPAEHVCKILGVRNQHDREKLEEAKHIVYKKGYYLGIMNNHCGKYANMPVERARDLIIQELTSQGHAETFYDLTGRVICRCLTAGTVKIVTDQWFIDYGNHHWKKQAHEALKRLTLYPEKVRQQFEHTIDWLKPWACTREEGTGTRLPWDAKWLIESLSDSTLYMAYYTISHWIKDVPLEDVNDNLFDYVFLSRGKKPTVPNIDAMRDEFEYWYPVDLRNSGKDLVQNHLTFYLFNHVALFPEKYWPRGISVNGWGTVNGQKMAKSLGNFLLLRDALKLGADPARITRMTGGEGLDDANWDYETIEAVITRLNQFSSFVEEWYAFKGPEEQRTIDLWLEAQIHTLIKETTTAMEQTLFRTALQHGFFTFQNVLKHYLKRTKNNPHKKTLQKAIETQLSLLAPFAPHLCEELWNKLGKDTFISTEAWPTPEETKINQELNYTEEFITTAVEDITSVLNLSKIEQPEKITLFVSAPWKYTFIKTLKKNLEKTRNQTELIKTCIIPGHEKETASLASTLIKNPEKLPSVVLDEEMEERILRENLSYLKAAFETEITILKAEESTEKKASQAMPGKPAILIV